MAETGSMSWLYIGLLRRLGWVYNVDMVICIFSVRGLG